jgi:hypothetical protein
MESLSELDCLVLYTKLSSCLWAHMSGRAGSTDRLAGLLVGRARLSGTAETLVGGDPWVPMSVSRHHTARARRRSWTWWRPRLEGRAPQEGRMARRSLRSTRPEGEGGGEEMCDAVTRMAAVLVEEAEEARCRGEGLPGALGLHGRPPAPTVDSSFSFPLILLLPRRAAVWTGDGIPEAAKVGSAGRRGCALLIAAGRGGRVDGADARTGAWPHRDGAPSPERRRSAHRHH